MSTKKSYYCFLDKSRLCSNECMSHSEEHSCRLLHQADVCANQLVALTSLLRNREIDNLRRQQVPPPSVLPR